MMRGALVLIAAGVAIAGGCGGGEDVPDTSAESQELVIKTSVVGATTPGAEPIATGEVADGSTLDGSPFCAGGTIVDTHGSTDPEVALIARTITCREGKVRMDITPEVSEEMQSEDLTQTGSWEIVSGTGDFEGLRGSGEMEIVYDPDPNLPARGTYTGTVTR